MFENYQYQDEGLRRAKAEGFAEGLAEAFAQGKAEGYLEGLADGLSIVLEARGFVVSPEARRRIFSCTDPDTLINWVRAAVSADSVESALAQ